MRFLIILLFILALELYSFQAVRSVGQEISKTWRTWWYAIFILASILVFTLLISQFYWDYLDAVSKPLRNLILTFVFVYILSKLFICVGLVVDDLRRLGGLSWSLIKSGHEFDASRSKFLTRFAVILGFLPAGLLGYGVFANAYNYRFFRRKIKINDVPKSLNGLKIIQISDIHSGSFWKKLPLVQAIEKINQEQPDLVFFTGDLVNAETAEMYPYQDIFGGIKAKYGVFSVLGNHDYGDYRSWSSQEEKAANMEAMMKVHEYMGWKLLRNEAEVVDVGQAKLNVIGVENYSAKPRFPKYGDLTKASESLDQNNVSLLLSHDPTHWDDEVITRFPWVNVTFSGHTHGMQFGIEIPGVIKWSPAKYLYPRWADLYQEGHQYLYVNRGFGFLGYPGRVGILPEITIVELC